MKGRRVFITGAGRGLGEAFAVTLADLGAQVTLAARNVAALERVATVISRRCGSKPETVLLDLADLKAVTQLTAQWRDEGRSLDILLNNAAMWQEGPFDGSDDELVALINANVTGTMLLTKGLLPVLQKSQQADVVNIVSVSGLPHAAQHNASVAFMASKSAQAGFTNALRQELRRGPIRLTAIYPPNLQDISPLNEVEWRQPRSTDAWVNNRDVVEAVMAALQRSRHVSFQSILIESATSNLHL